MAKKTHQKINETEIKTEIQINSKKEEDQEMF